MKPLRLKLRFWATGRVFLWVTGYPNYFYLEKGDWVSECWRGYWRTQEAMATIDVVVPAISNHLANVFETGELKEEATISKMETVQQFEKHLCKGETFQGFSFRVNLGNFIALGNWKEMQYVQNLHILHQAVDCQLKICWPFFYISVTFGDNLFVVR